MISALLGAVIRVERVHQIGVGDEQAAGQQQAAQHVEVAAGDVALQPHQPAQRDDQDQDGGEAGQEGAENEERRELGGMPADGVGAGEIQPDDAVHRAHQRRHDRGERRVGRLIVLPLPAGAAEAERQDAVEHLPAARQRVIAHRRQVRDQAEIPEQDRRHDIGQDGEEIPQQRAAELRPGVHRRGIRQQPVEQPWPAEMQDRIDAGAGSAEQRH